VHLAVDARAATLLDGDLYVAVVLERERERERERQKASRYASHTAASISNVIRAAVAQEVRAAVWQLFHKSTFLVCKTKAIKPFLILIPIQLI